MDSLHAIGRPPHFEVSLTPRGTIHVEGRQSGEVRNSFHVGEHVIAGAFQVGLPDALSDVVDVALAVYLSDRLCRRGTSRDQRYLYDWARHIKATIPVRNPDLWTSPKLYSALTTTLGFLTEDTWVFEFVPRGRVEVNTLQQDLFPHRIRGTPRVALFSGGLDSFGGLCSEIEDQRADTFVLVAGRTNFTHGHRQNRLAAAVAERTSANIIPCVIPYGFQGRSRSERNRDEPTQRTRGFVHAALGAATAVMAGATEVAIYENGIGAINLPYSGAQIGTHLTRAANPIALSMISDVLSQALDRPFKVDLPFVFQTKGEILKSIQHFGLGHAIDETNSCDRFLRQRQNQCGVCTSCVLRRQSLHAAGLRAFDCEDYAIDIYAREISAPERTLFGYRMMVDQVERLQRAIGAQDPWRSLLRRFPALHEIAISLDSDAPARSSASNLVALYRRYCDEWARFPARPPAHSFYTRTEHRGTHNG